MAITKPGRVRESQRYRGLLPPLSTEEREALERSIAEHRVQVPIVIDEDGVILDGCHRYSIAGDEAPTRILAGLTEAEKIAYVYQCNLVRRNLSPSQKKVILREMKKVAKSLRDENPKKNTQPRVAALLGVSQQTVSSWGIMTNTIAGITHSPRPDARIKINPKHHPVILARYESGETQEQIAADYGVDQSQISRMATVERKVQTAKAERIEAIKKLGSDDVGVRCGDLREIGHTVEDESVDLIFTDPVYHKDSLHLYGELAKFASRVLRPGAWCLAYSGHSFIPDILDLMREHLTYEWMFTVEYSGGDVRFRRLKFQVKSKPIWGFRKPPLSTWWDWCPTSVSGGRAKDHHKWEQPESEASHFINALCPEGGLVVDPFCGSGTTLIAAKKAGRQWIGIDVDLEAVESARARLANDCS